VLLGQGFLLDCVFACQTPSGEASYWVVTLRGFGEEVLRRGAEGVAVFVFAGVDVD
jgi:hypothetical protein